MKELEEKFDQILKENGMNENIKPKFWDKVGVKYGRGVAIRLLIQVVEDYFKQSGKQGGQTTKKKNPDYSALGKKGAAKRWKK